MQNNFKQELIFAPTPTAILSEETIVEDSNTTTAINQSISNTPHHMIRSIDPDIHNINHNTDISISIDHSYLIDLRYNEQHPVRTYMLDIWENAYRVNYTSEAEQSFISPVRSGLNEDLTVKANDLISRYIDIIPIENDRSYNEFYCLLDHNRSDRMFFSRIDDLTTMSPHSLIRLTRRMFTYDQIFFNNADFDSLDKNIEKIYTIISNTHQPIIESILPAHFDAVERIFANFLPSVWVLNNQNLEFILVLRDFSVKNIIKMIRSIFYYYDCCIVPLSNHFWNIIDLSISRSYKDDIYQIIKFICNTVSEIVTGDINIIRSVFSSARFLDIEDLIHNQIQHIDNEDEQCEARTLALNRLYAEALTKDPLLEEYSTNFLNYNLTDIKRRDEIQLYIANRIELSRIVHHWTVILAQIQFFMNDRKHETVIDIDYIDIFINLMLGTVEYNLNHNLEHLRSRLIRMNDNVIDMTGMGAYKRNSEDVRTLHLQNSSNVAQISINSNQYPFDFELHTTSSTLVRIVRLRQLYAELN